MQQLKDVYGDSIDKILQGNSGNLIYIKSTDDSMLETLQTIAGSTHLSYRDNKSVTLDARRQFNQADSKVTISTSVHEMPVISKTDMLMVPRANMMVFGKGHPIWNRNQMAMPYAYALQKNELRDFENNIKYSLQTVPTTASTTDFDILRNTPDFVKIVAKRVRQAKLARTIRERYKRVYGSSEKPLTEYQMSQIDQEVLSKQLMKGINEQIYNEDHPRKNEVEKEAEKMTPEEQNAQKMLFQQAMEQSSTSGTDDLAERMTKEAKPNKEVLQTEAQRDKEKADYTQKRYGGGMISREDLMSGDTKDNLAEAYVLSIDSFRKFGSAQGFNVMDDGSLLYGGTVFVKSRVNDIQDLLSASSTVVMPTGGKNGKFDPAAMVEVRDAFISWIKKQNSLADVGDGSFDRAFGEAFKRREDMSLSRDAG